MLQIGSMFVVEHSAAGVSPEGAKCMIDHDALRHRMQHVLKRRYRLHNV